MTFHNHHLANAEVVLLDVLAGIVTPPPPVDYLAYAKKIVFSERISAKPGPYNEEAFPFFSEILRALSPDDPCTTVTLKKSAQIGGTVAANIFTLGSIEMDPGDFLYVHPTDGNAVKWSKQKLTPLLKESASLVALFPMTNREGSNSILYKERKDGRGAISAAGANSPAQLSMVSPKRQVQDDLSKWEVNPAGDPESQADSRSKAFFNRKILKISTPLVSPGCRITRSFNEGSQEEYHVPCPHCGHLQPLRWENMEPYLDPAHPERAAFKCIGEGCGCFIEEHHRAAICLPEHLGGRARWVARHPERKRYHRSFYLWVAYSSLESWAEMARRWLAIKAGGASAAEARDAEQVFWNDYLGLPFEATGETMAWEDLRDRAASDGFRRGIIPPGVAVLTLGIDVQGDRCEWQLVGWGKARQRYVIDHGVLDAWSVLPGGKPHTGSITEPEMRALLDQLIKRTWPDFLGNRREIDLTAIDGNYMTADVLEWARRHPVSKVMMVRGVPQEYAAILSQVKGGEKNHKGVARKYRRRFFNVAVSVLKLHLYRGLKKTDPTEAGYVHIAKGLPDEYFVQLVSERRVPERTRDGITVYRWKLPEGVRNEALDTMNAANAAAHRLGIFQWQEDVWDRTIAAREVPPTEAQMDFEDMQPAAPAADANNPAKGEAVTAQTSAKMSKLAARIAAIKARREQ